MRRKELIVFVLALAVLMPTAVWASSNEGGGRGKVGYVYFEPYGNRSLYQENYNLYEGGVISVEDFWYTMENGLRVRADLRNMTLENRNLTFSADKSKVFSLSFYDNKYKRIYDPNDRHGAKREMFGWRLSITPIRQLKLYAGFDRTNRRGENYLAFDPISDPTIAATDFKNRSVTLGLRGFHEGGSLLVEYRGTGFQNYVSNQYDRNADIVRLAGTLPIPHYRRVLVSAGYNYRQDRVGGTGIKLRTNLGWGAAKVYLPEAVLLDYRFVYGYTKHMDPAGVEDRGTENVFNTVAVSKSWARHGGLRIGYDNRWEYDRMDRTSSNGFLFNGWYNYASRLFMKAAAGVRAEDVKIGMTLIGNEDYTRYMVAAKYADDRFGDLSARYQGRVRKREDLGTRVDYDAFSTELGLEKDEYGRFSLTYAYYLGKFENLDGGFAFSDHMVTARLAPVAYKNATISLGGTYFKSQRDLNFEKYSWDVGLGYRFLQHYGLEAKYARFDYRDLLMTSGGVFNSDYAEIYLTRDFTL